MSLLDRINQVNDIKKIPEEKLPLLAMEIREFLVDAISRTGGHLASSLGVVELTIALHRVYDLPEDKIIWDVGHQAYAHKILTGRKDGFKNLRKDGGMSGFPRRDESDCDSFDTGHSSTSVSAGLGYVKARDLNNDKYSVVSVIGDGALTGGMAFEAINNAAALKTNFVIVLNDNEMSISRNVGGISNYLGNIRTSEVYTGLKMSISNALEKIPEVGESLVNGIRRTKSSIKQLVIPGMFFENMGLTYLGPVDGKNISKLLTVLEEAKKYPGPVIVHVVTKKGRGYMPAMRYPARFHGTSAFDIATGLQTAPKKETYSDVFGKWMYEAGKKEPRLVAITAAMKEGTGLSRFASAFPSRFFDTGIAEGHAVTFAAGLSLGGMIPVFAVYSSFLQRGYDQLLMDVCLQKLHVIFAIDRAGLVGADGKTHQGCFDLSYLSMMPGMTILAPADKWELREMLDFALRHDGPVAVRYPRGEALSGDGPSDVPLSEGRAEVRKEGEKVALLAVGSMTAVAEKAAERLDAEGLDPAIVNMRFVKPFDRGLLRRLSANYKYFVTLEENVRIGSFGQQVQDFVNTERLPVRVLIEAVPDEFVSHGSTDSQRARIGLDPETIAENILSMIREDEKK